MDKDNFFEMAKTVQDTYMSGNLQGQRYMLENMIIDLQSKLNEINKRISETPPNNLTQSK
jgi:hypothetical protein